MFKSPRRIAVALLLAGLAGACTDAPTAAAPAGARPLAATTFCKLTSATISPQVETIYIGGTVDLIEEFQDACGNFQNRPPVWTSTDTTIATVSSTGRVTGKKMGTVNIIGWSDLADTVTIAVRTQPTGGPSPAYTLPTPYTPAPTVSPLQPPGMYLLVDRDFNSEAQTTSDYTGAQLWDPIEARYPNFSIAQDPTAPTSGPSVGQIFFPVGFGPLGIAPATLQKWFTTPTSTVYMSLWIKLSPNFQGGRNSTNKMFFLWIVNQTRFFLSAEGAGSGPLQPQVRMQGVPDARHRLKPNVNTAALVNRGVWQHWELVVKANTPGVANGEVQWWIDGSKVTDYRDLFILAAGEPTNWTQLQWSPTWGGTNDTVLQDMWIRWDDVFMAGK